MRACEPEPRAVSREPRSRAYFCEPFFFYVFNGLRFLDIYKCFFPLLDRALAHLVVKTYLAIIIKMIGSIGACTVFTRSILARDLLDRFFSCARRPMKKDDSNKHYCQLTVGTLYSNELFEDFENLRIQSAL